jgi:hypothetical protein
MQLLFYQSPRYTPVHSLPSHTAAPMHAWIAPIRTPSTSTTSTHRAGTLQYLQYVLLVRPAQVACPLSHVLVCRGLGAATPATYRAAGHGSSLLHLWGMGHMVEVVFVSDAKDEVKG